MKPFVTILPDTLRPLHSIPLCLPVEKANTQEIKSDAKEVFVIDTYSSTLVNDPSGWDESWFANYE